MLEICILRLWDRDSSWQNVIRNYVKVIDCEIIIYELKKYDFR